MFRDREEAGRQLATALREGGAWEDTVVLGLARGGVPVAAQVAEGLGVPFDVCIVRKLGVPWQRELAMGAIASGGVRVLNDDVIRAVDIGEDEIDRVAEAEAQELERREHAYRGGRSAVPIRGKTIVLVDDGLATGASMRAAVEATRRQGAEQVIVAVPVAPSHTCQKLRQLADDVVCLDEPDVFFGVGQFYADFSQTTDAEVVDLLAQRPDPDRGSVSAPEPIELEAVLVRTPDAVLQGDLGMPPSPTGLVLFAHGSGSSRKSPRNREVAATLQHAGFATLLFDLLTMREDEIDQITRQKRFDIDLLARRMVAATDWARGQASLQELPIGLFGASTGAAAALICAAERPDDVAAVVSRGGRPDLADEALARVQAPTLLLVGARDPSVLALNEDALAELLCEKHLAVVPDATHLFEEPGTLEQVSRLAVKWFEDHLRASAPRSGYDERPAARP